MFVVSRRREIVYNVLATVTWLCVGYLVLGIVTPFMSVLSRTLTYTIVALEGSKISAEPVELSFLWPLDLLVFMVPFTILMVCLVLPRHYRYGKQKQELDYLNQTLTKTRQLQEIRGNISYSTREAFGNESAVITRDGANEYTLITTGMNAFGAVVTQDLSIVVTATSFTSNEGASFWVMREFHAALELARMQDKLNRKQLRKQR